MSEYKVFEVRNINQAEELMNEMAKNNWKVASTSITDSNSFMMVITFIREVNDPFRR